MIRSSYSFHKFGSFKLQNDQWDHCLNAVSISLIFCPKYVRFVQLLLLIGCHNRKVRMEILIKSNLMSLWWPKATRYSNNSWQYQLSSGLFTGGRKSVDIKQHWSTDYHGMMVCLGREITLTAKYKYAFVTSWYGAETSGHNISQMYSNIHGTR